MRHVVFLAYNFPPRNTSGAVRPGRFARYLREYGYTAEVVSVDNVSPGGRASRAAGTVLSELAGLLKRYGDRHAWVYPAVRKAEGVIKRTGARIVFSTAPPFGAHIAGLLLKRRNSTRWIADFRDPLRENAFRPGRIAGLLDQALEQAVFRHADWLIANTDELARLWDNRDNKISDRRSVIWNGYDPEEDRTPSTPHEDSPRRIAHVGAIYGPRHPGQILRSIERLTDSGALSSRQQVFQFVGPIEEDSDIRSRDYTRRLIARGILEMDGQKVPRAEAWTATTRAHALLLIDLTGRDRNVQVPAKLFDYIRAQKPILAMTTPESPAERILKGANVPHICLYPGDDDKSADRKLMEFLALSPGAVTPSEWFNETFDVRRQTGELAALFDRLWR